MAVAFPTARDVWASLTAREQVCLGVLFDEDERSGGPESWRWLDLGGGARASGSPVQRRLKGAGVPLSGPGRPVERLEGRGLLRTVSEPRRTLVRLTAAGRDAARTAVPARYRRRPPGLLSREAWRCLALIHAAGPGGWPARLMPRRELRCFERHRAALARLADGSGEYFDLRARRPRPLAAGEQVWTLTPAGIDHLDGNVGAYGWLYPDVVAMDPEQPWEREVCRWRRTAEQLPDDVALALEQMEHVWGSAERVVRTARRGGLPSSGQWRSMVFGGLPIPVGGLGPWLPMRELEAELDRNVSAYWSGLERIRWCFASCFTVVAAEVVRAATTGLAPSLASILPLMGMRIAGTGRPLLLPRPATGDPGLDAGVARSHAVATATGATPEDLTELGRHLVELLRRARLGGDGGDARPPRAGGSVDAPAPLVSACLDGL
jgi:hypothetical protein